MMKNLTAEEVLKSGAFIIKLASGETLYALITDRTDYSLVIMFPMELKDNEMVPFCHLSANRRFDLSLNSILFIKRPVDYIIDILIDSIIDQHQDEYNHLVETMRTEINLVQSSTKSTENKFH
jgi:hypothetical protein